MMPEIGKTIGQYTLLEQIGTGGMATVYRAKQSKLERDVAVKIMHQTFLADAAFMARFEREARIVARLDHPNIVPIYDYDQVNGVPYLVMKYVNGKTLKRRLNEDGALPLEDIIKVTDAIGGALSYAHRQGILHRDIKPSNIILDEQGTPYLMDFGLARIAKVGESTMSADMMIGTPFYISPEQAQGEKDIDHRADVYSLGVVLYELVVGQPPFTGETPFIIVHKHIFNVPTPPSQINPDIPPEIDAVILKALAKAPADRYDSADELARAFKDAVRRSGLSRLKADRAAAAAQYKRDHPSPVPENVRAGRDFTVIPSPYESSQTARVKASQIADEVVGRVRDTVFDIRAQVQDHGFSNRVREKMVSVTEQIENAADRPGISRALRLNRPSQIERDFGMREEWVRARVEKQIEERRGFIGHLITFILVGGIMFMVGQNVIPEIIIQEADPELLPLAQVNLALAALFPWFGALIAHGIGTFKNTGGRVRRMRNQIDKTMTERYGDDWVDTATDRQYRPVRNAVKSRFSATYDFFQTFAVLGSIWALFAGAWPSINNFFITLMQTEGDLDALAAYQSAPPLPMILGFAFMIPLFILAARALLNPLVGAPAREREIARELARSRASSKRKNETRGDLWEESAAAERDVRLTGDGELTESFVEEIQQQRRTR